MIEWKDNRKKKIPGLGKLFSVAGEFSFVFFQWLEKQQPCRPDFLKSRKFMPEYTGAHTLLLFSSKSGSALIMVLAVTVMLTVLIAGFGIDTRNEIKAATSYYEEAINYQLARSALALARLEIQRKGAKLYADNYGNAYFVQTSKDSADYEEIIEELSEYRRGFQVGRGMLSYKIIYKPNALDFNELSPGECSVPTVRKKNSIRIWIRRVIAKTAS